MSIKDYMLAYFEKPEVNEQILSYINRNKLDFDNLDDENILKMLEDLNLIEEIQAQMDQPPPAQHYENEKVVGQTLTVTIEKGRKFIGFKSLPSNTQFFITLSAFSQSLKTNSLKAMESFSLSERLNFNVKASELRLDNYQNIELCVIIVFSNGKKLLHSIKMIEWRFLLTYGSLNFDIQLAPYYHEGYSDLPCAGILSLRLSLASISKLSIISETLLNRQLDLQKKNKEENNSKFYTYANNFWNQFKNIHKSFQVRRVLIYGDSEDKIYVPLCKMISPLYNIRGIDSPNHALRFCSLIPFSENQLTKKGIHKRFSSILGSNEGSVDDHCHLLCSLLLGFGLKAYVCIGNSTAGEHSWVMCESNNSIVFWETTKGIKMDYYSPKTFNYYKSIHTVYNHNEYYANIQFDDSLASTKFNFKDINSWKPFDQSFLEQLNVYNHQLCLFPPTLDVFLIEENIQTKLTKLISNVRQKNKLSFSLDTKMSSILSIALANYEIERVTGNTFCQDQFQTAIKNYIPLKHTFKAFPIQLTTLDAEEILSLLLEQAKCKQIILSRGDSVNFGLKCKLIVFPHNIFAIWISVAVRYYKIN